MAGGASDSTVAEQLDELDEADQERHEEMIAHLYSIHHNACLHTQWLRRIWGALVSLLLVLVILTLVSIRAEWLNEQPWEPDSEPTAQQL